MPGEISASYDPEWGTSTQRDEIAESLGDVYETVSDILGGRPPMDIRKLVHADAPGLIDGQLTEKEWRLIRFAIERAKESL